MSDFPPIRFIPFESFTKHGGFPRYPECKNMIVTIDEIPRESSLIIMVSHRWLRGGLKPPYPDTDENDKWTLCNAGITQILKAGAPGMKNCYLWLDFACIDQSKDPAGELKQLDKIVEICDCLFTPVYDPDHASWSYPSGCYTNFDICGSSGWKEKDESGNINPEGYVSRGWCRMEMFYAANIPIISDDQQRSRKFASGLQFHRTRGRRPQYLYSSKEYATQVAPILLAPLVNSYFEDFHPEKGYVTMDSDKVIIRKLIDQLAPYMTTPVNHYKGEMKDGQPHGRGTYLKDNGDEYNGEWQDGMKHGKGKITFSSGSWYEGGWRFDKSEGVGIFSFACGDKYQGQFQNDNFNGEGQFTYSAGQEYAEYTGTFRDDVYHGFGTLIFSNGDCYEGNWANYKMEGKGKFFYADGKIYDGEFHLGKLYGKGKLIENDVVLYDGNWKDGKRNGFGRSMIANEAFYEGQFKDDHMEGQGKLFNPDGTTVEGEWKNGLFIEKKAKDVSGRLASDPPLPKNDSYKGQMKDCKPHGEGTIHYNSGESYKGHWIGGKKEGNGFYFFSDGTVYEGTFLDDKMHGKGKLMEQEGSNNLILYEGDWENDERNGFGKGVVVKGESVFEGEWRGNQMNGQGKLMKSDGTFVQGIWKDGEMIKKLGGGKCVIM
jgi:hypothetical protein